jgi:hypothetical protein
VNHLALLASLTLSSTALAAPIEFVEQRKNFMVFDDDGTVENANWFSRDGFYAGYYPLEEGFLAVHPDDGEFIIVYSTFDLVPGVGAFFQSLANDVQGIGYEQAAELDPVIPAEFFDDTPNSKFVGMLHMNNWRNFVQPESTDLNETWISLVFGQELGHAWLAFTYFDQGNGLEDRLLGRAQAHWSFYMHTGGSPVEGHRWTDHGDGTFTAAKLAQFEFSDLDLYLMGLMPPEEVAPWFIIEDPHDCIDSAAENMECPPPGAHQFKADQFRISGTRRDITIDDVIAAEGPRIPAYPDAPSQFNLSFLLIKRPGEVLCEEEYELIDRVIERSLEVFEGQTRGRATLVNRTATADPIAPGIFCEPNETTGTTGDDPTGTTGDDPTDTTGKPAVTTSTGDAPGGDSTGEPATASAGGTGGEPQPSGCGCQSVPRDMSPALLLLSLAGRRRRRA